MLFYILIIFFGLKLSKKNIVVRTLPHCKFHEITCKQLKHPRAIDLDDSLYMARQGGTDKNTKHNFFHNCNKAIF